MRGVDKNASVLGRDDRLDDGCKIVDIRQGLDAEDDIIEGSL